MLSCPSENYFFTLRGVSDEAKPVLITGQRNGTLELWLTAKLDHMKGQQSVKKELSLSLEVSYVFHDVFFLVPAAFFFLFLFTMCIYRHRSLVKARSSC